MPAAENSKHAEVTNIHTAGPITLHHMTQKRVLVARRALACYMFTSISVSSKLFLWLDPHESEAAGVEGCTRVATAEAAVRLLGAWHFADLLRNQRPHCG